MFHIHTWTKWVRGSRRMMRIDRWGLDTGARYVEWFQHRNCTKCGRYQEEVI